MDTETVKNGRAHTAERIRRAVLTLRALPDREKAWLDACNKTSMPEPVRLAEEAYGYESAKARRFTPTHRDVDQYLETFEWLCWLRRQNDGKRDYRIVVARVHGTPYWKLADRHHRSEETIRRWRDGAIAKVFVEYQAAILADMAEKEAA
ncbi:MAG: hypothetical protein GY952_06690 [Rhodobacteraceae bacterium]|nr:hypothetical protein [Paracoccaceae bacterium]